MSNRKPARFPLGPASPEPLPPLPPTEPGPGWDGWKTCFACRGLGLKTGLWACHDPRHGTRPCDLCEGQGLLPASEPVPRRFLPGHDEGDDSAHDPADLRDRDGPRAYAPLPLPSHLLDD